MMSRERKYSDEELLEFLTDLAKKLGRTPTYRELTKYGGPVGSCYTRSFGGFNAALVRAGLTPNTVIRHNSTAIDREELIDIIRETAARVGSKPKLQELVEHPKQPTRTAFIKYFGSMDRAIEVALEENTKKKM